MIDVIKLRQKAIDYIEKEQITRQRFSELCKIPASSLSNFLNGRTAIPKTVDAVSKYLNRIEPKDEVVVEPKRSMYPTEKVELTGVTEILEALYKNEKVFIEGLNHYFILENGFIIRCSNNQQLVINTPILLDEKYYVEAQIKPQLRVGKMYLSVDGRKCLIHSKDDDDLFIGMFLGESNSTYFMADGQAEEMQDSLYKEIDNA